MNKFYDNLAKAIVLSMMLVSLVVELPVKILNCVIFFILFVVLTIFAAPFLKHVDTPTWWDNWCEYCRTPKDFYLIRLIDRGWGYML